MKQTQMNFLELHELVPLARYGKPKSLSMSPFKNVELLMPGRHAEDTSPKGGDFVVCLSDTNMNWRKHQFKHDDIFNDVETKALHDSLTTQRLVDDYLNIIAINSNIPIWDDEGLPGIYAQTFLHGVLALAVAEHRRYAQHEPKFGGRFLPFRFAAGIAEGLWTAHEAIQKQRFGRPAVERLEKSNGAPVLTQKLFDTTP